MEGLFGCHQRFLPGGQTFRGQGGSLLPEVSARFGGLPHELWAIHCGPLDPLRGPIITDHTYISAASGDLDGVTLFTGSVVPMGVEVVEARLDMRNYALSVQVVRVPDE